MAFPARSIVFAFSVTALLTALAACAKPATSDLPSITLDKSAEYRGRVIGPITRGQPEDATQFTSYELELEQMVEVDDRSDCGHQTVRRIPIENDGMAQYLGKRIRISGVIYCRVNRTGTYHMNEVKKIRTLP